MPDGGNPWHGGRRHKLRPTVDNRKGVRSLRLNLIVAVSEEVINPAPFGAGYKATAPLPTLYITNAELLSISTSDCEIVSLAPSHSREVKRYQTRIQMFKISMSVAAFILIGIGTWAVWTSQYV